ncbi:hypothetical protein [Streptomyces sp. V4I2]|uniref:hypothetical protein n=1 Tax=Streptomyces sp. V4I2 TaxID=3042280 RepID=UPI0027878E24|nr:hypothetical protein [Streptomyces sp. V4I2]MDQ1049117.1 hypothetical protein [Streptomyces sp. V4I2]
MTARKVAAADSVASPVGCARAARGCGMPSAAGRRASRPEAGPGTAGRREVGRETEGQG